VEGPDVVGAERLEADGSDLKEEEEEEEGVGDTTLGAEEKAGGE
jgi:hypothetical protein